MNMVLYVLYLAIFIKKIVRIRSFYQCFSHNNPYEKTESNTEDTNKTKYFYALYFA